VGSAYREEQVQKYARLWKVQKGKNFLARPWRCGALPEFDD
jgi:hypothetical protein